MFNRLKIFADVIGTLLQPAERPLAMEHFAYVAGEEDLGQPRPTLGAELVDAAVGWHSTLVQGMADRLVAGCSLVGWPGCEAQLLSRTEGNGSLDLLVTDRRLLVIDLSDTTRPPVVLWVRDRMHVVTIRRAPRFAQAGRLWVVLADGSAVALMFGLVNPGPAKSIVAAWGEVSGAAR